MTDQERYLFDLQGYVAIPNALDGDHVAELNRILDAKIAEHCEPNMQTHRFGGLLNWGEAYTRVIDNPGVESHLSTMLGQNFRLDHIYLDVIRTGKGPIGTTLHGGGTPHDPSQYYHYQDGRMFNGLTVVAYNLRDVNPGDGGFGCVPCSHKSSFRFPGEWRDLENAHPRVDHVIGPAGTAVIFTEALTHGTLPWNGSDERRTLFFKYSPNPLSWSARYFDADDYEGLTERQKWILLPPNVSGRRRKTY